jgi:hypothetical protein
MKGQGQVDDNLAATFKLSSIPDTMELIQIQLCWVRRI